MVNFGQRLLDLKKEKKQVEEAAKVKINEAFSQKLNVIKDSIKVTTDDYNWSNLTFGQQLALLKRRKEEEESA
jgi:hypothetical protein